MSSGLAIRLAMATIDRYHRQALLPVIGREGQSRISRATVAVVGVGALGCASAELLARAGVGRLILIDRDIVELTNLQRQTLYTEADAEAGRPKAHAARERLRAVNSEIEIVAQASDLSSENAEELLDESDVIVDGTDNFETRYLLNDLAQQEAIPLVIGGAVGTRGTITPVIPERGPCLRCLEPELPVQRETCDTTGVLGPIVQIIGARQAAIALRVLSEGEGSVPIVLEEFDAWTGQTRSIELSESRNESCVCCVQRRFDFLDGVGVGRTTKLCGRGAVQVTPPRVGRVNLIEVAASLSKQGEVTALEGLVRAVLVGEPPEIGDHVELTIFSDGRAIVKGTEEASRARAIYSRYVTTG
ncbi:MAG: molybdopterin-synthase adenylyltransferase MoeB [Phycisphaerales bacterium]